jgi:hypothetical protein
VAGIAVAIHDPTMDAADVAVAVAMRTRLPMYALPCIATPDANQVNCFAAYCMFKAVLAAKALTCIVTPDAHHVNVLYVKASPLLMSAANRPTPEPDTANNAPRRALDAITTPFSPRNVAEKNPAPAAMPRLKPVKNTGNIA